MVPRKTVRLRITGRVQGVGYRAWMVERATARGLGGWVRNRRDGSVEALVSGEAKALETLLAECREGPPSARVSAVEAAEAEYDVSSDFTARPTAA